MLIGTRALLVGLISVLGTVASARAEPVSFVGLGDMPYSEDEAALMDGPLRDAIIAEKSPFLVHWGDIKSGGASCADALLETEFARIAALQDGPVFFTPGDNEWTDCDRPWLETRFSELERLAKVRALAYASPMATPEVWNVERQPNYPENAIWTYEGVVFVTLHVVGTNNGRMEVRLDDPDLAMARTVARDHANRVWLDRARERACGDDWRCREPAKALIVIAQADITNPSGAGPCTAENPRHCDAFEAFRGQLRLASEDYPGPMLFLHGDSRPYCWDRGFGGAKAPRLWRLNGPGDGELADALRITVTGDADTPFDAVSLLEDRRPDETCD
jgi:hypothetical protein